MSQKTVEQIIVLLFFPVFVMAAAPKVVKTVPENGDTNVKPGPTKIRILFDQDMSSGGYSICGSGENFPEPIGKPQWTGKRSIVFGSNLKPNHEYIFSVNAPSAQNFKSVRGEPAEVTVITFKTTGADGTEHQKEPGDTLTAWENRQAALELKRVLVDYYSYNDLKKVDWEAAFKQKEADLSSASTPEEFAGAAGQILAKAKDKHIWLMAGNRRVSSYVNPVTPNANFQKLATLVPAYKKINDSVCTGKFAGGIGYIAINSWNSGQRGDYEALYAALTEFANAPGLIIDVRANGGGSEPLAQEFAGCFIDEPKLYSKHVYRQVGEPNAFGPVHDRVVQPNKARPQYRGKVAVLVGPVVISSCESFVLMMKQIPGCVLVGEPTQGSSGNPKPYDLGNGVTVYLPSWKDLLPDGTCLEGVGIAPDVLVKVRPPEIMDKDPVIEAALAALQRK